MGHLHQSKGDLEDVALSRKVQKATHYAARPLCAVLEERLLPLAVIAQTRHCANPQVQKEKFRKLGILGRLDNMRGLMSQAQCCEDCSLWEIGVWIDEEKE